MPVDLYGSLRALWTRSDHGKRGTLFQHVIAELFRHNEFRVTNGAWAAAPRDTDIFATYGHDRYLVEVKWESRDIGIPEIDELRVRLEETPPDVVGVFVSMSDFTHTAVQRVEAKRTRPIVLIGPGDVARLATNESDLYRLIRERHEYLVSHAKALWDQEATQRSPSQRPPPEPVRFLTDAQGRLLPWLTCGGDFSQALFVDQLQDLGWGGPGHGVALDLRIDDRDDAVELALNALSGAGWLTDSGQWSIHQSHTNWHGWGADSFRAALAGWESRYEDRWPVHHTEEVRYHDTCPGGFFALQADVSSIDRQTRHTELSVHLEGIPLDPVPLQRLADDLLIPRHRLYFRPLVDNPADKVLLPSDRRVPLEVVGLQVALDRLRLDPSEPQWVTGILAKNPFLRSGDAADEVTDWPPVLLDTEVLMCSLRNHHPVGHAVGAYHLRGWSTLWIGDTCCVRLVADWDRPPWQHGDDTADDKHPRLRRDEAG